MNAFIITEKRQFLSKILIEIVFLYYLWT